MTLRYCLLDEPLVRIRLAADGRSVRYTLPGLLAALAADAVRDFPALRPHQRHPWHAFLVQLAALALHRAGQPQPFSEEVAWRATLLALTPDHPDGAPWCLIAPHDRPAFMQAPVPGGQVREWKNTLYAPDKLDMLVTAKNHDLKGARMRRAEPDDWLTALISLQTQEGCLGQGNYGISRMNGGFASRPALGVAPSGLWGRRWSRDLALLLQSREHIVTDLGLSPEGGIGLLWLQPWDGSDSLPFASLDPFYIEICRRVRLFQPAAGDAIAALATGSKAARIDAKALNGITGDPWTPIHVAEAKALTISADGFHYKLAAELLFGSKYRPARAQLPGPDDDHEGLVVLAQGVTRGQGKTEG